MNKRVLIFRGIVFLALATAGSEAIELELAGQIESKAILQAIRIPDSGQVLLSEGSTPILQYNYAKVEPGEVLSRVSESNLKYARPRSDYIHPLYGFDGEEITFDWPPDHPHHRGIYWAWPEVEWNGETADLHALQRVFARPTGKLKLVSGGDFAQVEAENLWLWEDDTPIVREIAVIRAYPADARGRFIDLGFFLTAVQGKVSVARRDADKYGGLNVRLAQVEDQLIIFYTDEPEMRVRMAWAELSGLFQGGRTPTGLSIFQHRANPGYPGDWVEYPELNWFQPTFPASGTRYTLKSEEPVVLRYRLWIHRDHADAKMHAEIWEDYQSSPNLQMSN